MVSICIPIYNFDVQDLVKDLHQQGVDLKIVFEIVCLDDGSTENFKKANRNIQQLPHVRYEELAKNLGRSKIRNQLGKIARFPYLIFMDCDSATVSPFYLQNYCQNLPLPQKSGKGQANTETPNIHLPVLLYGGRVYDENPPAQPSHYFHWLYGSRREQMPAEIRQIKPHHAFMTNNFLIPKSIFLEIQFDESLTQYGHEDTLFGLELKKRQIPIIHLDNPLKHIGLETTAVFLQKTDMALQNLYYLNQKSAVIESRLLRILKICERFGLTPLLGWIFRLLEQKIIANFHTQRPNLTLFDFYKLGRIANLKKGKKS